MPAGRHAPDDAGRVRARCHRSTSAASGRCRRAPSGRGTWSPASPTSPPAARTRRSSPGWWGRPGWWPRCGSGRSCSTSRPEPSTAPSTGVAVGGPGGGRRELGRPPVRGVPGARPPPAPDAGRRELLGGGGRRLHPRLPVQVLGLRVHHRRTALRRVGPAPVAPGLAGHGRHAHRHLRLGGCRVRVAVPPQPRRDRGGRARVRRARGDRPRRHRRRHAAVPVQHGVVHLATVGVRRHVGGREVPGRGGVLQQLRHGR